MRYVTKFYWIFISQVASVLWVVVVENLLGLASVRQRDLLMLIEPSEDDNV